MNDNTLLAFETDNPNLLMLLCVDEDWTVRQQVASNVYTRALDLLLLSKDPVEFVRMAVSLNENASGDVLFSLFTDESVSVRTNAYYHKNADKTLRESVVWFGGVNRSEEKESFYQFRNRTK